MSDVTIVIDADTARYIAKIAQMAEATKGAAKPLKEHNELYQAGIELLGSTVMKMTAVGAAIGVAKVAADGVTAVYDNWVKRLEHAYEITQKIQQAGKGPLGGSAAGPGADRTMVLGIQSQLSDEQRFSALNAYRQSFPGSTSAQRKSAIEAASGADAAGFDSTEFAGNLGKLKAFGGDAKDIAGLATGRGGEHATEIVELLAKIAASLNPEQAKAMLPLALSAANVHGGMGVLSQQVDSFLGNGMQGSMASTVRSHGFMLAPQLQNRSIMAATAAGEQPLQTLGQFEGMAGAGAVDPLNAVDITKRRYAVDVENMQYRAEGAAGLRKQAGKEFQEAYDQRAWANPLFSKNINELVQRVGYYDNYRDPFIAAAAQHTNAMREHADALENNTKVVSPNGQTE